jgi:ribonuclease HI
LLRWRNSNLYEFLRYSTHMQFTLYADGGARGNPGPAGAGAVVFDSGGKRVVEVSDYLGVATNNIAEYEAILRGLTKLAEEYLPEHLKESDLTIRMDSKLVIEQLKGNYKVKHPNLVPRYMEVKNLLARSFGKVSFEHVYREKNTDADELANRAMDKGS